MLSHVGSKWSGLVLMALGAGPRTYAELHRSSRISERMLTLTLRALQRDGLVEHDSSYALTPAGESLRGLLTGLLDWTDEHAPHIMASRSAFE